jgi:hypothetical protein
MPGPNSFPALCVRIDCLISDAGGIRKFIKARCNPRSSLPQGAMLMVVSRAYCFALPYG